MAMLPQWLLKTAPEQTGVLFNDYLFFLIAGPCVIEDSETPFAVAECVQQLCKERQIFYIFKSSYRKANRTKGDTFQSIGDAKALEILAQVKQKYQLPVLTDIHLPEEAAMAAAVVDILQIPAFLCRQTDILIAAGKTGKPVNIKKGQFLSPEVMQYAAGKVVQTGNSAVILTERGTTFGYQDLVVDFRSVPIMQQSTFPVVLDCTHCLQRPNQPAGFTGGAADQHMIRLMARAGIAVGVDGLFIETHPNPKVAKSDADNMLALDKLAQLLDDCVAIRKALNVK